MADDDGPTSPGLPFEPADTEDGPTLQVYVPSEPVRSPPSAPLRSRPRLPPPPPSRPVVAPDPADFAETIPLSDSGDADQTLPLRRPVPSFDEVATTPLASAPVTQRIDPIGPPPSEQTRPFLLVVAPEPSSPFPLVQREALLAPPVVPRQAPPQRLPPPPPTGTDLRIVLAFAATILVTLALALVIVVFVLVWRTSSSPAPAVANRAPQRAGDAPGDPRATPAAAEGCSVRGRPRRIASSVLASVPPMVSPSLSRGEVAVGLAESRNGALGVVVDLTDLSSERRFSQSYTRPVFRATPVEQNGSITYLVDHDDPHVQAARSVPAAPPFVVGVNYFGFVRLVAGREPETLWPGGKGNAISEPMFASVPNVGHAVTFARGRVGGSVHVGWLSASGQPKTELQTLELTAHEVGAPRIAAAATGIVIALAARDQPSAPWRVMLARAEPGKLPGRAEAMTSGAGPDRKEPAVVALDAGWLVSWIEGPAGSRRIRAQRLDAALGRVEAPFDVVTEGAIEETPGALHRVNESTLSLYVVRAERGYELWGAVIGCG